MNSADSGASTGSTIVESSIADETTSQSILTLKETPPTYTRLLQSGSLDITIDVAVHVPEIEEVGQYLAQAKALDSTLAIKALGGEIAEGEAFTDPAKTPFETHFIPKVAEDFELLVNGGALFHIELTDLHLSYVAAPQNKALEQKAEGCEITAQQAIETAQSAAAYMNADLVVQGVEAYHPCPPDIAAIYDKRPPSPNGFYVVSMIPLLDGLELRYATSHVTKYQEMDQSIHSFSDPGAYKGFRFTIDDQGIRALDGRIALDFYEKPVDLFPATKSYTESAFHAQ